jgi:hypothetical protein
LAFVGLGDLNRGFNGIIVHLPLTTVGVCVFPSGGEQVYVGGVDGNVDVRLVESLGVRVPGILRHSSMKRCECVCDSTS